MTTYTPATSSAPDGSSWAWLLPASEEVENSFSVLGALAQNEGNSRIASFINDFVNGMVRTGYSEDPEKRGKLYQANVDTSGGVERAIKKYSTHILIKAGRGGLSSEDSYESEEELLVTGLKTIVIDLMDRLDNLPDDRNEIRESARQFVWSLIDQVTANEEKGLFEGTAITWYKVLDKLKVTNLISETYSLNYWAERGTEYLFKAFISYKEMGRFKPGSEYKAALDAMEKEAIRPFAEKWIKKGFPTLLEHVFGKTTHFSPESLRVVESAVQTLLQELYDENIHRLITVIAFLGSQLLNLEIQGNISNCLSLRMQFMKNEIKKIETKYRNIDEVSSNLELAKRVGREMTDPWFEIGECGDVIHDKYKNGYGWGSRYIQATKDLNATDRAALIGIYREFLLAPLVKKLLQKMYGIKITSISWYKETKDMVEELNHRIVPPFVMPYVMKWADDLIFTTKSMETKGNEALAFMAGLGVSAPMLRKAYEYLLPKVKGQLKGDDNPYVAEFKNLPFEIDVPEVRAMIKNVCWILIANKFKAAKGDTFAQKLYHILETPLFLLALGAPLADVIGSIVTEEEFENELPLILRSQNLYQLAVSQGEPFLRKFYQIAKGFNFEMVPLDGGYKEALGTVEKLALRPHLGKAAKIPLVGNWIKEVYIAHNKPLMEGVGSLLQEFLELGQVGGVAKVLSRHLTYIENYVGFIAADYLAIEQKTDAELTDFVESLGAEEYRYGWKTRLKDAKREELIAINREFLLTFLVDCLVERVYGEKLGAHLTNKESKSALMHLNKKVVAPLLMPYMLQWTEDLLVTAPNMERKGTEAFDFLGGLGDQGAYFNMVYSAALASVHDIAEKQKNAYIADWIDLPRALDSPAIHGMIHNFGLILLQKVLKKGEGVTFDEKMANVLKSAFDKLAANASAEEILRALISKEEFESELPIILRSFGLYDLVVAQLEPFVRDIYTLTASKGEANKVMLQVTDVILPIIGNVTPAKAPEGGDVLKNLLHTVQKHGCETASKSQFARVGMANLFSRVHEDLPPHVKDKKFTASLIRNALSILQNIPETESLQRLSDDKAFYESLMEKVKKVVPLKDLENGKMIESQLRSLIETQMKSLEDPLFETRLIGTALGVKIPEKETDIKRIQNAVSNQAGKAAGEAVWKSTPFVVKFFFLPFVAAAVVYTRFTAKRTTDKMFAVLGGDDRKLVLRYIIEQSFQSLTDNTAHSLFKDQGYVSVSPILEEGLGLSHTLSNVIGTQIDQSLDEIVKTYVGENLIQILNKATAKKPVPAQA